MAGALRTFPNLSLTKPLSLGGTKAVSLDPPAPPCFRGATGGRTPGQHVGSQGQLVLFVGGKEITLAGRESS